MGQLGITPAIKQQRIEEMADHLIVRKEYFRLDNPEVFLEWGAARMTEGCDIDALFDLWLTQRGQKKAALSCNFYLR